VKMLAWHFLGIASEDELMPQVVGLQKTSV